MELNTDILNMESGTQRKERRKQYISWTVNSKNQVMKRDMIDLIDTIHDKIQNNTLNDVNSIKKHMALWQKQQFEPVNFEMSMNKKLIQI